MSAGAGDNADGKKLRNFEGPPVLLIEMEGREQLLRGEGLMRRLPSSDANICQVGCLVEGGNFRFCGTHFYLNSVRSRTIQVHVQRWRSAGDREKLFCMAREKLFCMPRAAYKFTKSELQLELPPHAEWPAIARPDSVQLAAKFDVLPACFFEQRQLRAGRMLTPERKAFKRHLCKRGASQWSDLARDEIQAWTSERGSDDSEESDGVDLSVGSDLFAIPGDECSLT